MTISGIDSTTASAAAAASAQGPWQNILSSVSNLLDTTPDAVRQAVRGGSSLSDLAAQKGISNDQLVSTIATALQSAGGASSANDTQLAQEIAARKGVQRGHHGHHHHKAEEAPQDTSATQSPDQPDDGSTVNLYA